MNIKNAKKALIKFQKKHESYLDAAKQYQEYKKLPFWKKWFVEEVKSPKDYCYDVCTICCTSSVVIELRMYFSGKFKEITLAINEKGNGYKLNIDTKEKTYYLGSVNPNISLGAELILEDIRRELAPLYIV
jgi:hypothetical protein